ncbi:bifunctional adenosylcobinamide kinase/adenosylcobinamide-phosphate guanylyltransferase, partial [Lacrimispora sp.]
MTSLIIGGSGSGKSEYAENLAVSLGGDRKVYIATMKPWDEECRNRILR